jgi:DNA-binding transcriptional ArsR family regulator
MAFPKRELFSSDQQLLSGRSQALAHPARLLILELLKHEPMHVRDLTKKVPLVQATVSSHLDILCRVGFLDVEVEGRYNRYKVNEDAVERYWIDLEGFMVGILGDGGEGVV